MQVRLLRSKYDFFERKVAIRQGTLGNCLLFIVIRTT